jgi:hypothetical protein
MLAGTRSIRNRGPCSPPTRTETFDASFLDGCRYASTPIFAKSLVLQRTASHSFQLLRNHQRHFAYLHRFCYPPIPPSHPSAFSFGYPDLEPKDLSTLNAIAVSIPQISSRSYDWLRTFTMHETVVSRSGVGAIIRGHAHGDEEPLTLRGARPCKISARSERTRMTFCLGHEVCLDTARRCAMVLEIPPVVCCNALNGYLKTEKDNLVVAIG